MPSVLRPILSTSVTHVPVFLITGPTCRYARFASLASLAREAIKIVDRFSTGVS